MKRDIDYHRDRATSFLSKLSFDDKLSIMYGSVEDKVKLGLSFIDFCGEAAHGVQARHDQNFDFGEPQTTTVFPNPIGMAATFDKELMHSIGDVVGTEMRSLLNEDRHNGLLGLAPTVDMERDPRWGRNEEGYGEDPYLTTNIAGEYILGMAGDDPRFVKCGATLKHFYANNFETGRYGANSEIPEDLKESYYIKVFRDIIDKAQPLSVMSAYNRVNDITCTFNPENKELLRKWGVPFIISDAFTLEYAVTHHKSASDPIDAIRKGLDGDIDMFMEIPDFEIPAMNEAIDKGIVTEDDIDKILTNRLTIYSMLGLMPEDIDGDGVSKHFPKSIYNMSRVESEESVKVARRAADESIVLLKNDGMLPLDMSKDIDVFAFGPFVDYSPLDWYSGICEHRTTLKEAMNIGCSDLIPEVYLKIDGKYACIVNDAVVLVDRAEAEVFSVMLWDDSRVTFKANSVDKFLTTISPDVKYVNYEEKPDEFKLYTRSDEIFSWVVNESFQFIDDRGEVVHFNNSDAYDFCEDGRIKGIMNYDGSMTIELEIVQTVEQKLEESIRDNDLNAESMILACFGVHPIVNSKEERDRDTIELPPFDRAVLRRLRELFKNITFILFANEPVAIVEENDAPEIRSIMWTPTGCQEMGVGIADVISGSFSPSGRLPQTWYMSDDQLGDIRDYDIRRNKMTYLFMEDKPLYRFGYGLTYSKFESELKSVITDTSSENEADHRILFEVNVKNVGDAASDYVVQIYQSKDGEFFLYGEDNDGMDVTGRKIPIESKLVAFERIHDIKPGETVSIKI